MDCDGVRFGRIDDGEVFERGEIEKWERFREMDKKGSRRDQ